MLRKATEEKREVVGSHMSPVNGPAPMGRTYRFGEFLLDPWRHRLSRADSPIFLTPKAFDLLVFLVQNPNRLVSKAELLQAVWQDPFVEAGNLTPYITHLRKALGDNAEDAQWIVTIARTGYQFAGDIVFSDEAAPLAAICRFHNNNSWRGMPTGQTSVQAPQSEDACERCAYSCIPLRCGVMTDPIGPP